MSAVMMAVLGRDGTGLQGASKIFRRVRTSMGLLQQRSGAFKEKKLER